jgi:hypothetical protein
MTNTNKSNNTTGVTMGGHPKGSTTANILDEKRRIELATHSAVQLLAETQSKKKWSGSRIEKGALTKIIKKVKQDYQLPDNIIILESTVRQRLKRSTKSGYCGLTSPMMEIEPYIVSIIIQLANMRVPITSSQGLGLCNSIIQGTKFQKVMEDYKKKFCQNFTDELGPSYWRGFLKWNKELIRSKKPVRFEAKRVEWCTYLNMQEIYDKIYSQLVEVGLAVQHPEPVWHDKDGNVVDEEHLAVGLKSRFELIHPDWLIFVDEVGCNTSQTKDGQVGGEKFLCTADGWPQMRSATEDAIFTVLGFTAASGALLMCAIIFAAKEVKKEWVLGFDPFALWVGDDNNFEENTGNGISFPHGSILHFQWSKHTLFLLCFREWKYIRGTANSDASSNWYIRGIWPLNKP